MKRTTACFENLLKDASNNVGDHMWEAAERIDYLFGAGYAKAHPELVGAFMQAAAIDMAGSCLAQQVTNALDTIGRKMP